MVEILSRIIVKRTVRVYSVMFLFRSFLMKAFSMKAFLKKIICQVFFHEVL